MDRLRNYIKRPIRKIAEWTNNFSGGKIVPNHITWAALILHLPILFAIVAEQYLAAALMLAVFGLLDSLDGELARVQGRASKAGMLLDASTDRIKESLVMIGLSYRFAIDNDPRAVLATIIALSGAYSVSYIKAKGETALKDTKLSSQEINRIFQSGLMRYEIRTALLVLGLAFTQLLLPILWVIAVLSWMTAFYRLSSITKKISEIT